MFISGYKLMQTNVTRYVKIKGCLIFQSNPININSKTPNMSGKLLLINSFVKFFGAIQNIAMGIDFIRTFITDINETESIVPKPRGFKSKKLNPRFFVKYNINKI